MGISIVSVGSSSSGNSYIIKGKETTVLLDVGLSARKITKALSSLGCEPGDVDAVLITHEHTDHIKSVRPISAKCKEAVFLTSHGTYANCKDFADVPEERVKFVAAGDSASVGEFDIKVFGLSHDAAEPVGYSISSVADGDKLTIATDTGMITEEIYKELLTADKMVFEANYEDEMLMAGPYPYKVKVRIRSEHGHLSNSDGGSILSRVLSERSDRPAIMLAHLSANNNTPHNAEATVVDILRQNGFVKGEHYDMVIAEKEGLTRL